MFLNSGVGEDSRGPWTARRSNQSILKGINPEYSLEGLMLKLQYFGYLMQRANSLEKTLMLGKIERRRRRGQQRTRWLDGVWANSRRMVKDREAWHASVHGVAESDTTEWLKRTTTNPHHWITFFFAEHFTTECLSLMTQNSAKEMKRWGQVWRDSSPMETLPWDLKGQSPSMSRSEL